MALVFTESFGHYTTNSQLTSGKWDAILFGTDGTVGDRDSYAYSDIVLSGGSILGVMTWTRARKDDAGARSIAAVARRGSTDAVGATQSVGNSYLYFGDLFETDPDPTPENWTI